jgi:hypothetical protein
MVRGKVDDIGYCQVFHLWPPCHYGQMDMPTYGNYCDII